MRDRGQGVWLDGFRRLLVSSGVFEAMVRDDAVSGVDCDLNLLAGAIGRGVEYADPLLRIAAADGELSPCEALLADEARIAAEALRGVFEATGGRDGLASVPAGTSSADDAESMSRIARRMATAAGLPNVVPKLPPTGAGFAVFEAMTAESLGVHIGPLFSLAAVQRATEAYVRGARARAGESRSEEPPPAVISFGVGPLDVAVDELLREKIQAAGRDTSAAESLLGGVATAVAKVAYRRLREILVAEAGAAGSPAVGSLLLAFADLSTGDARQPRRRYVESLTGPDTTAILSSGLLRNVAGRGEVDATLGQRVDDAEEILLELRGLGVDVDAIGEALEAGAIKQRASHFATLSRAVQRATEALLNDLAGASAIASTGSPWSAQIPEIDASLVDLDTAEAQDAVARLWARDPTLWSGDAKVQELIANRLGWLDAAVETQFAGGEPQRRFAGQLQEAGVENVLLLGMGGSSLSAEVCCRVFESERVRVLDSTVPARIRTVAGSVDPARTSILVASKSGTTTEVRALLNYFYALATPMLENPGERFAAITDPGTPLEQGAHELGFQRLWLAPADVGGRFSALTVFGTLPMAIMGVETPEILASARRMVASCSPEVPVAGNPAARLASAMHGAMVTGRDKLTFLPSPSLAAFGAWAEQLVAESTGKAGTGVIPIVAEPPGSVEEYADDRFFVSMRLQGEDDPEASARLDALEAAGHPVARIVLEDRHDIGGEFFRWEAAVALLGALMGINPFDQPDVQASKDRTAAILAGAGDGSSLAERSPAGVGNGWAVYADLERDEELAARLNGAEMADWLSAHLGRAEPPDYVGIQAFVAPERTTHRALQRLRVLLRRQFRVATSLGWGPRFLHSTGQLHKGGPDSALFLQITADDAEDIEVPGAGHSFGELARAQSMGDFAALQERGRRVVRVHLSDPGPGAEAMLAAAKQALS